MGFKNVSQMFDELKALGLLQEEFPENTSPEEYWNAFHSKEDDEGLKELLMKQQNEELIRNISLEELVRAPFMEAKNAIDQMTLAKRISILEDLQKYRDFLYEDADRYGKEGLSKDDQLNAAEFRSLVGKIKHLEIIQNWLYGVI